MTTELGTTTLCSGYQTSELFFLAGFELGMGATVTVFVWE
jgi:hypothetical protein